jgi:hypothetical protein
VAKEVEWIESLARLLGYLFGQSFKEDALIGQFADDGVFLSAAFQWLRKLSREANSFAIAFRVGAGAPLFLARSGWTVSRL